MALPTSFASRRRLETHPYNKHIPQLAQKGTIQYIQGDRLTLTLTLTLTLPCTNPTHKYNIGKDAHLSSAQLLFLSLVLLLRRLHLHLHLHLCLMGLGTRTVQYSTVRPRERQREGAYDPACSESGACTKSGG